MPSISTECKVKLDSNDTILTRHKINKDGPAQKFFTHEVRRLSDPYCPFLTGALKNTAVENPTNIQYVVPYARRQWYTNPGNGTRGKEWCLRMWAARKDEIVKSVANYVGGKVK